MSGRGLDRKLRERFLAWNDNDGFPGGKIGGIFIIGVTWFGVIACLFSVIAYFLGGAR